MKEGAICMISEHLTPQKKLEAIKAQKLMSITVSYKVLKFTYSQFCL